MIATINLLPWRQTRRRACLRFWSVLFGASLLLSSGVLLRYYSVLSVENQVELLLADAEKTRAEALMALKPRVQQRQQRWQQVQARNKQREQTRSWQRVLHGLAELLPEQAWLTKITWQQETLELTGNTLSFAALKALEAQLRQLPLFKLGSPGETQQDAQGRWQFHYRLMRSGAHENAL
ncbi:MULTISPECIES: PilN domain-containing protein [unclassified Citrobacter]|uniref:PilN domain-containing protein n=1 Tax=unclassified Citrobacter TaxID=2644389 RepID=UPI0015E5264E|nr:MULTISPECIES: PilN domain-containing protein [unclassified Citrobacter]QLO87031.1 PilN domain-containing protein [Citrobacter sp. RHBSTW-00944]QLX42461.1 PilN domain-containing protein [Citrobacter sp. RHBSTW-00229]